MVKKIIKVNIYRNSDASEMLLENGVIQAIDNNLPTLADLRCPQSL